jgi:hypothetical protein
MYQKAIGIYPFLPYAGVLGREAVALGAVEGRVLGCCRRSARGARLSGRRLDSRSALLTALGSGRHRTRPKNLHSTTIPAQMARPVELCMKSMRNTTGLGSGAGVVVLCRFPVTLSAQSRGFGCTSRPSHGLWRPATAPTHPPSLRRLPSRSPSEAAGAAGRESSAPAHNAPSSRRAYLRHTNRRATPTYATRTAAPRLYRRPAAPATRSGRAGARRTARTPHRAHDPRQSRPASPRGGRRAG